jgi:nucleoid DNA-binding protein
MNNQSGLSENFQNRGTAIDTLDIVIVNALLKDKNVVVPDFGYLELKLFPDKRRTVLFKAVHPQDLPQQIYLDGLENEDHFSTLLNCISKPLKEGKTVSMPNLGIFRPLRREDGKYHISFTPSSILRKCLNEEGKFEVDAPQTNQNLSAVIPKKLPISETLKKGVPLSESGSGIMPELPAMNESEKNNLPEGNYENGFGSTMKTATTQLEPDNIEKNIENESENKQEEPVYFLDENEKKKKAFINYLLMGIFFIALIIVVITVFFPKKENVFPVTNIQSGSRNLVDVARKNYGNPVFWVYIYESNQDKLTSPVNIPENVVLTIPDLSEYNIDITDSLEIVRARLRSESILQKYIEKNNK